MKTVFALVASLLGSALAIPFAPATTGGAYIDHETGWNQLKCTFGKFSSLPTTVEDSRDGGWSTFNTCVTGGPGLVYYKDGDISTMPFFDHEGKLAGIQMGAPTDSILDGARNDPWEHHSANDKFSTGFSTITAYFVDPEGVCNLSKPRTAGCVGDRLWIKDGSSKDYIQVPLTEDTELLAKDGWVDGKCFWTMGKHYWRYINKDTTTDDFYPMFLLYNGGQLNGFGPAFPGTRSLSSERWEHPEGSVIKMFFNEDTMPEILPEMKDLNTQHIYMDAPLNNFC